MKLISADVMTGKPVKPCGREGTGMSWLYLADIEHKNGCNGRTLINKNRGGSAGMMITSLSFEREAHHCSTDRAHWEGTNQQHRLPEPRFVQLHQ
jgi:hypothetical protein